MSDRFWRVVTFTAFVLVMAGIGWVVRAGVGEWGAWFVIVLLGVAFPLAFWYERRWPSQ